MQSVLKNYDAAVRNKDVFVTYLRKVVANIFKRDECKIGVFEKFINGYKEWTRKPDKDEWTLKACLFDGQIIKDPKKFGALFYLPQKILCSSPTIGGVSGGPVLAFGGENLEEDDSWSYRVIGSVNGGLWGVTIVNSFSNPNFRKFYLENIYPELKEAGLNGVQKKLLDKFLLDQYIAEGKSKNREIYGEL